MKALFPIAAICVLAASPALAEDKTSLTKDGAKEMSGPEKEQYLVGIPIKGEYFNDQGKKVADWTTEYKNDGAKISTAGGKTVEGKWWMDGNEFCETLRNGSTWCGGGAFKLASTCYTFHPNGAVQTKFNC